MSAPVRNEIDDRLLQTPTMYAPPWAREEARAASAEAADTALAASAEFRRVLPPAPLLTEPERRPRWREPAPFEGDLAAVRLRERTSLDPVAVPPPPLRERGSATGLLVARIAGAIGFAALAALLMVGTLPLKGAVKAESETTLPTLWSRFGGASASRPQPDASQPAEVQVVALAERFADMPPVPPPAPIQTAAVPAQSAPVAAAETVPAVRALGRDEIAAFYRRGEELIAQGDIAAARLLLTRAAEAGDARSALALGATYDAAVLGKLAVLGVAADGAQARAWYEKAAELGSGDATRRLEQLAQGAR